MVDLSKAMVVEMDTAVTVVGNSVAVCLLNVADYCLMLYLPMQ